MRIDVFAEFARWDILDALHDWLHTLLTAAHVDISRPMQPTRLAQSEELGEEHTLNIKLFYDPTDDPEHVAAVASHLVQLGCAVVYCQSVRAHCSPRAVV
jgi:hypothetical protein